MPRLIAKNKVKGYVKESLEGSPITLKVENKGGQNNIYPYIYLPLSNDWRAIEHGAHGMAHVYFDLFGDDGIREGVFPEAKAWFLALEFCRLTGIDLIAPDKKNLPFGDPIQVVSGTAYRSEVEFSAPKTGREGGRIIVDDTISGGITEYNFTRAYENAGCIVPGGISLYERGNGIEYLKREFPDKKYAGFARMEIRLRDEERKRLEEKLGTGDEDELIKRVVEDIFSHYCGQDHRQIEYLLGQYLRHEVTGFYDD
jgi:adenine/guanine phosphoribosyltransferase-like PRPP-binding protein